VVSLAGLAIGGALFLASTSVGAATALRATDIGEGATVFYTLSLVLLSAAGFGIGLHLLATSLLAMRTNMLPSWLVYLGLVAGVAFVISAVIGSASDGSGAMIVGLIGFVGWSVWILGISVTMWRDVPASEAAATA
jgi:hypothetical protein